MTLEAKKIPVTFIKENDTPDPKRRELPESSNNDFKMT
jgi:hypothetical protein